MPVAVAGGGEAAGTVDRPIDRRIYRNNSSRLRRNLSAGFALIIVIAAAGTAAWVGLFSDHRFAEQPCPSAVLSPPRAGCVATMPIQDIAVAITATIGLAMTLRFDSAPTCSQ
jgi:hypothetical protein